MSRACCAALRFKTRRRSRIRGVLGPVHTRRMSGFHMYRACCAALHPLKGATLADRRSRIRGVLGGIHGLRQRRPGGSP
jgi:hypothetical protein